MNVNLLTLPFRLPLLPLHGVIRIGEIVRDEVEQQLHDPALVRRQLEEASEAKESGEISGEDAAKAAAEAVSRVVKPVPPSRDGTRDEGERS